MTQPTAAELSGKSRLLPGVPQHGTFWCIPASIENMLRTVGIQGITQEDLIEEYVLVHMSRANSPQAPRAVVLERFRCQPIPGACFGSFKTVAERILAGKLGDWEFYLDDGVDPSEYAQKVKDFIAADSPVLISAENPSGGSHITVVYKYDGDMLYSYDSGLGQESIISAKSYTFRSDILVLQRRS